VKSGVRELRIDPEFRGLIAALSDEERGQLEANLVADGCRDPLVVWNGLLLDGHNRHEICARRRIPFRVVPIALPDRQAARIWIRWNQLGRRNLTDDQRAGMTVDLLEELAAQSKRQRATTAVVAREMKAGRRPISEVTSASKIATPRVREKVSKRAGVSQHKIRQAATLKKRAPALHAKVKAGEIQLAKALRTVKRATVLAELEDIDRRQSKIADGVFDVIVLDPPWPTEKIERDERPHQVEYDYPRMTEEEIRAITVPCADTCHIWLWTTQRFVPLAFDLLRNWGLTYVCTFVWHKPGGFQPVNLPQFNCEFVLYARKGSPMFLETTQFPTCFSAPRGRHSEKPEAFYELVRRVTAGRRLDMFNRRPIEGFEGAGKEAA
jgi:N6-adenosine-specific RNA methylase IME4